MNELYAEFKSQGLSVVGVTGETAEKTDPWCEENGVKYPYAYETTSQLFKGLKCKGYPSAVLINPQGNVVWAGHPASINSSIISKHIKGADKTPVAVRAVARGWPPSAKGVKKWLGKQLLGKAMDAANKLAATNEDCKVVVESLLELIDGKVAEVKAMRDEGDFLGVLKACKSAKKSLAGLPQGGEMEAIAKEVSADADAKPVIKAQKAVAKIKASFAKIKKKKDVDSRVKKLRKIAAKNGGNIAGKTADKLIEALGKRRERMVR